MNRQRIRINHRLLDRWIATVDTVLRQEVQSGTNVFEFNQHNNIWVWAINDYWFAHIFVRMSSWRKTDLVMCQKCWKDNKTIKIYARIQNWGMIYLFYMVTMSKM